MVGSNFEIKGAEIFPIATTVWSLQSATAAASHVYTFCAPMVSKPAVGTTGGREEEVEGDLSGRGRCSNMKTL